MRINLVTPFAEKDAVKALGAHWDGAKKTWYITDAADLTPFMRWIPNLEAAQDTFSPVSKPAPTKSATSPSQFKGLITKAALPVAHCGCQVLPWDHCEHSLAAKN